MFVDNNFPRLLGAELYRPTPQYVAEMANEPVTVHDFGKAPGQTVQLDRYAFWGTPGTKDSRERSPLQTIGTANSRDLTKTVITVTLKEYTGPADPSSPNSPSTFKISRYTALTAQRMLWQYGLGAFHQSIGSINLLDDYRRWRDIVWIRDLMTSPNTYNPGGQADSTTYGVSSSVNVEGLINITRDLMTIVEALRNRFVPTYADGSYRALSSPRFMRHLRANADFRATAQNSFASMQLAGMLNPTMPWGQPNAPIYMGPQYGQFNTPAGQSVMPTGFVYEGVRFFETNNMPTETVNIAFAAASYTSQTTVANDCLFFGPQALGLGKGGNDAQVLLNNNDDFSRFLIAIWCLYAAFQPLNTDFVTVARTYAS